MTASLARREMACLSSRSATVPRVRPSRGRLTDPVEARRSLVKQARCSRRYRVWKCRSGRCSKDSDQCGRESVMLA